MSNFKLQKDIILSLEDELEDDGLPNPSTNLKPLQPVFKKKGPKGKKLNQRKVTLDLGGSDEEVQESSFMSKKRSKFKSSHTFVNKNAAPKLSLDIRHTSKLEVGNEDIKYTKKYLEELNNQQMEQNEDLMDIDKPVIVEPTPAMVLHNLHKSDTIDDDDDINVIPINEYGSDDHDDHNNGGTANKFPADDDLIPDDTDAFVEDGPLNLGTTKFSQSIDIDEDLYDTELPIEGEDLEVESDISKPIVAKIIKPVSLAEHYENLKKSIESIKSQKLVSERRYHEVKIQLNSISRTKEQLLIELNL